MTWDSYVWKTVIFSIQAANSLMKCIPSSLSSFQSTRPRGARHNKIRQARIAGCFNPRARAGRDGTAARSVSSSTGFNPRARAGRDPHGRPASDHESGFNPRARAGRDLGQLVRLAVFGCFNPRARAGRD